MRIRSAIVAAPLLLILVAGCATEPTTSAAPSSVASPSTSDSAPTPTQDASDTVDRISLGATTVTLWSGDREVSALSTDDADIEQTVAGLGEVFGEPEVTTASQEPSDCAVPSVTYSWGDALNVLDYSEEGGSWEVATIRIFAAEATGLDGGVIRLESSNGVAVGDDVSALVDETPGAEKQGWDDEGVAHMTVIVEEDPRLEGDGEGSWGLGIEAEDDVATTIGIPYNVNSAVDC